MKIIKTASGKQKIKISKKEWEAIGKKAGWTSPSHVMINGRVVDPLSIEVDGINPKDAPDFVDAYISSAYFIDGTPLTDDELEKLDEEYPHLKSEAIYEQSVSRAEHLSDLAQDR